MKNRIIVINGYPESGKDEFIKQFILIDGDTINYSTIDFYKTILMREFGWDGKKTEKSREALSKLKAFDMWFHDGPFQDTCNFIDNFEDLRLPHFLFIHSREPDEIKRLKERYNAITLLIDRYSAKSANNTSDMSIKMTKYDYVIDNNGTKQDLKKQAKIFYDWIRKDINEN
jgi:hypothetical protein